METKNIFKKTIDLIQSGKFNEALEKLDKVEEKNSDIFFLMGSIYLNLKKIDLAEKNLKLASKLNDKNHSIFHNLAVLYTNKGDHESAKNNYLKAIKINNNVASMYELANLYIKIKNYDEAQKYYEHILKNDPNHKRANIGLGNLYMIKNDFKKGHSYINKATGLIRFSENGMRII